eukprot:gnl/Spiro4/4057_TR2018_c0_g2_i1.p2 gnl/Spiro4/4057_TR2018_c0_g2~~gnl/Spiro4/4057_TR2018_c0_g2_i1.p2  ORF type:complete len:273 (+),score=-51.49 gnl/Spiro4/4057_TR2018_c0_g2_i1:1038-1856(+)
MSFYLGTPLYVDIYSDNRLNGSSSDFMFEISEDLSFYDSVVLLTANIPKSYLLVPANTSFVLTEISNNSVIVVPSANYSINNFCNVIQTLLNNNTQNGYTYTVTTDYNSRIKGSTGLLTITCSNTGAYVAITFNSNSNLIHEQFGFHSNSTNVFNSGILVSVNCVLFQSAQIVIKSDMVNETNQTLQVLSSNSTSDYSYIQYINNNPEFNIKRLIKSRVYRFFIVSMEDGSVINLRGCPSYISLLIFRRNNAYELIRSNLLVKNYDRLATNI